MRTFFSMAMALAGLLCGSAVFAQPQTIDLFESVDLPTFPVGDLDGDEVLDVVQMRPLYCDDGHVEIVFDLFHGATGRWIGPLASPTSEGEFFGLAFGIGPDVDGDGVYELFVTSPMTPLSSSGTGVVHVYSPGTGRRINTFTALGKGTFGAGLRFEKRGDPHNDTLVHVASHHRDPEGNILQMWHAFTPNGNRLGGTDTTHATLVAKAGDLNGDWFTDAQDLIDFLDQWLQESNQAVTTPILAQYDQNSDGMIDENDIVKILEAIDSPLPVVAALSDSDLLTEKAVAALANEGSTGPGDYCTWVGDYPLPSQPSAGAFGMPPDSWFEATRCCFQLPDGSFDVDWAMCSLERKFDFNLFADAAVLTSGGPGSSWGSGGSGNHGGPGYGRTGKGPGFYGDPRTHGTASLGNRQLSPGESLPPREDFVRPNGAPWNEVTVLTGDVEYVTLVLPWRITNLDRVYIRVTKPDVASLVEVKDNGRLDRFVFYPRDLYSSTGALNLKRGSLVEDYRASDLVDYLDEVWSNVTWWFGEHRAIKIPVYGRSPGICQLVAGVPNEAPFTIDVVVGGSVGVAMRRPATWLPPREWFDPNHYTNFLNLQKLEPEPADELPPDPANAPERTAVDWPLGAYSLTRVHAPAGVFDFLPGSAKPRLGMRLDFLDWVDRNLIRTEAQSSLGNPDEPPDPTPAPHWYPHDLSHAHDLKNASAPCELFVTVRDARGHFKPNKNVTVFSRTGLLKAISSVGDGRRSPILHAASTYADPRWFSGYPHYRTSSTADVRGYPLGIYHILLIPDHDKVYNHVLERFAGVPTQAAAESFPGHDWLFVAVGQQAAVLGEKLNHPSLPQSQDITQHALPGMNWAASSLRPHRHSFTGVSSVFDQSAPAAFTGPAQDAVDHAEDYGSVSDIRVRFPGEPELRTDLTATIVPIPILNRYTFELLQVHLGGGSRVIHPVLPRTGTWNRARAPATVDGQPTHIPAHTSVDPSSALVKVGAQVIRNPLSYRLLPSSFTVLDENGSPTVVSDPRDITSTVYNSSDAEGALRNLPTLPLRQADYAQAKLLTEHARARLNTPGGIESTFAQYNHQQAGNAGTFGLPATASTSELPASGGQPAADGRTPLIDAAAVAGEFALGFVPGSDAVDAVIYGFWKPVIDGDTSIGNYAQGLAAVAGLAADAGYFAGPLGIATNAATGVVQIGLKWTLKHDAGEWIIENILRHGKDAKDGIGFLFGYVKKHWNTVDLDELGFSVPKWIDWAKDSATNIINTYGIAGSTFRGIGAVSTYPAKAMEQMQVVLHKNIGRVPAKAVKLQGVAKALDLVKARGWIRRDTGLPMLESDIPSAMRIMADVPPNAVDDVVQAGDVVHERVGDAWTKTLDNAGLANERAVADSISNAHRLPDSHLRNLSVFTTHIGHNKAFRSVAEFESMRVLPVDSLTDAQKAALRAIRQALGGVAVGTPVRKVMSNGLGLQMLQLNQGLKVRGFMARQSDLVGANSGDELISRLRLDYDNQIMDINDGLVELDTVADAALAANTKIPMSAAAAGNPVPSNVRIVEGNPPYTGNGIAGSLDGHLTPEFEAVDTILQPNVTRMRFKNRDGTNKTINMGGVSGSEWVLRPHPTEQGLTYWEPVSP